MRSLISYKKLLATGTALLLLAGCASTPAPVVNHSFGGSSPPASSAPVPVSTAAPAASGGVQTFGLGGHANGTVTSAGYSVAPGDTLYSIAFANGLDFRALAAGNGIPPPYVIHPGQVLKLDVAGSAAGDAGGTDNSVTTVVVAAPAQPSAPVFGPVTRQPMTAGGVASATSSAVTSEPEPMPGAPAVPTTAGQASPVPVQQAVTTPPPPSQATRKVAGIAWRWPAAGEVVGTFRNGIGGDGAGVDIAGKAGDPVRAAASGTVVYSGNGLIGYGELIIVKHNDTYLSAYGHNSKRLVKEGQQVDAGQEIALMGASGAPRVELHFEIRKNGKPVDPVDYLPQR